MEITVFLPILSLFILSLCLLFRHKSAAHGFKTYPLVGTLPDFLLNRHRFLDWSTEILSRCPTSTAVFHRPGKIHGVITANPAVVEHILKTNFENYPKGTRFRTLLQDFLGNGIFNSDGDLWKVQRKTASYEFNTKSLRSFVIQNVVVELQRRLIPILETAVKDSRILDIQDILERFAFDNICKVSFNVDPGCLGGDATVGAKFMADFDESTNLSSGRFMYALPCLYRFKKFLNIGSEKSLRKSIATVHEFADNIIENRMKDGINNLDEDLLSRFIGSNISDHCKEFLRDIVISFLLAGRDTTSSALSFFFWQLSLKPEVEEKILQELRTIKDQRSIDKDGYDYSFDELREMHYLQAAISESMRLYPPVPVDTKACKEADVLPDGTRIGKDWFISYHTYAMGRMESIWGKDCNEYKPERWIENGICRQESAFRYPVFHAGQRMCLGKEMAYIQMKCIVACVLERFRFDVVGEKGRRPDYLLSLTLRMKGGLMVRVRARGV